MKRTCVLGAVVLALLVASALAGAQGPQQGTPQLAARTAAAYAAKTSSACLLESGNGCILSDLERLPVVDDIIHYRFKVRVGSGPFDVIGMHRVVRERRPFLPAKTTEALFVLHGSGGDFEVAYLTNILTGLRPPTQALPVFLAQRGVDVWAVDLGWTMVPADTTDFSFFADWGIDKEISQIRAGLAIARALRAATSGDAGRMDFLGWSYGAQLGYILVAEETQLPSWRRHVKGFIPVDMVNKFDPATRPAWTCDAAAYYQYLQDSGQYGDGSTAFQPYLAGLAINYPDDPSPVFGWLNNYEAALLFGSNPWDWMHQVAGTFNASGRINGLQYTDPEVFIHGSLGPSPWAPVLAGLDQFNTWCDQIDVPFDDHLGDVQLPTLHLGAAGGVGQAGVYSTTLLGSTDVTIHMVRLHPAGEEGLDFGHWDLWVADNAAELAWQPVLDWLRAH